MLEPRGPRVKRFITIGNFQRRYFKIEDKKCITSHHPESGSIYFIVSLWF